MKRFAHQELRREKPFGRFAASRLAFAAAAVVMLAGCALQASSGSGEAEAGAIVVTDFADREVSFVRAPERIVALGNGEVDIVYALGGTVVGRPEDNGGGAADHLKDVLVVGSAHTVDLEKIASLKPDVVLGNDPINRGDVLPLEGIGAKTVLTQANSIADITRQIELLGVLLAKEDRAAELIAGIDEALAELTAGPGGTESRVLMVYGAPGTYLAALPNSLAGNLLETAGGRNVAADFPRLQNYPQYAQLNTERVVEADPDAIFIMTHGNSEEVRQGFVREMEGNPAWNRLQAVRGGNIHVLPADLFGTNPGTRVTEAAKLLAELLAP
ncbi:ABC transporter substrate-binding protein [Paenibacillus sp. TRM 82003]|nr:ABC transporter substrate-binding protein [Paenibacillus sp. TRM 82003]